MTQTVNINGQELELEQCVIDGDELDTPIVREVLGMYEDNSDYILSDPLEDNMDYVTTVPEDEQFIKEYIDSNLDSQIDDQVFNKLLEELDREPEVMPSCHTFVTWLQHNGHVDLIHQYEDYVRDYQKELREWWFKRNKRYVTNEQGDVLMRNGIPVTKEALEGRQKIDEFNAKVVSKIEQGINEGLNDESLKQMLNDFDKEINS